MKELRQIIQRWHEGSASILVTLTRVQGSSYRQPGARSLVCKDGTYAGGISAGCLEADLLRKAAWLTRDGAAVERYSTLFDEESAEMPFGLGCGGILDVLLEPVERPECQALLRAVESTISGCEHLVATWLPQKGHALMRAIFRADGEIAFVSDKLPGNILSQIRMKCLHGSDTEIDGIFIERLLPLQRLFVFGAGDDAKPLVTMASLLGWDVTVIDRRVHLASKTRFSDNNIRILNSPDIALRKIKSADAVVIMTHSYEQDRDYLAALLPLRRPRYLGLLGSRQRSALLIADAAARLQLPVSECCEQIYAPVGLDIGGEGPEAIALAIIAEAQACCMGKGNASRRLSAERIQHYLATGDRQSYVQNHCALDTI